MKIIWRNPNQKPSLPNELMGRESISIINDIMITGYTIGVGHKFLRFTVFERLSQ